MGRVSFSAGDNPPVSDRRPSGHHSGPVLSVTPRRRIPGKLISSENLPFKAAPELKARFCALDNPQSLL
jgi:hypothetical protein